MPFTNQEAEAAYERLVNAATQAGLSWLIDDVRMEIALRMQMEPKPNGPENEEGQSVSQQSVPPDVPPDSAEPAHHFSPRERLRVLVDALEAVSAGLTLSAQDVFRCLGEAETSSKSIVFEAETGGAEGYSMQAPKQEVLSSARKLADAFRCLKEAI